MFSVLRLICMFPALFWMYVWLCLCLWVLWLWSSNKYHSDCRMPLLNATQFHKLQLYTRKKYKDKLYNQRRHDLQQLRDQKKRMAVSLIRDALHLVAWDKELQRQMYNRIEMISHWSCGHGEITESMRQMDIVHGVQPESELDYDSLFTELAQERQFRHIFHPNEWTEDYNDNKNNVWVYSMFTSSDNWYPLQAGKLEKVKTTVSVPCKLLLAGYMFWHFATKPLYPLSWTIVPACIA